MVGMQHAKRAKSLAKYDFLGGFCPPPKFCSPPLEDYFELHLMEGWKNRISFLYKIGKRVFLYKKSWNFLTFLQTPYEQKDNFAYLFFWEHSKHFFFGFNRFNLIREALFQAVEDKLLIFHEGLIPWQQSLLLFNTISEPKQIKELKRLEYNWTKSVLCLQTPLFVTKFSMLYSYSDF